MRTAEIALSNGSVLKLRQKDFHGSARGATDATGTTLWPTALPLLLHLQGMWPSLQASTGVMRPLRVLELGAGCGLLGMGLAATCGANVVLSESGAALGDGEEDGTALSWLESNVELNREVCELHGGQVSTTKLSWGDAADMAATRSQWAEGFDLCIASDVLYDNGRYPELLATLEAFSESSPETAKARGTDADAAAAVLGYQIRNGQERRFGDESEHFTVLRDKLPGVPKPGKSGRNPTGKSVAYLLRKGVPEPASGA